MTNTQQLIQDNLAHLNPRFDYDLTAQAYFKIGGPAEVYFELDQVAEVQQLVKFCAQKEIKFTVIGGASNILIDDQGIVGVVLRITADELDQIDKTKFRVSAGIKMSSLVQQSVQMKMTGLEFFLGVPGYLGGAVYNNAHYLQDLIGEHIYQVEIVTRSGELKSISHIDCKFAYDSSIFQQTKDIIWSVVFELKKGDKDKSAQLIKQATEYRAKTQPLGLPSSGCIFQNIPNTDRLKKMFPMFAEKDFLPGGFVIDQAGLKNKHVGDIYVSDIHAAFLVNKGRGSSKEVLEMIDLVKSTVKQKFEIDLKEEIFYLK